MPTLKPAHGDPRSCPPANDAGPFEVTPEILAICRSTAWDLYKARNLTDAEIVARGLVAALPSDWYHHALLAATLQKQRRFREALAQADAGLAQLPGQTDLVRLRAEIFASAERLAAAEQKLALRLSFTSALAEHEDGDDEPELDTPTRRRRHYLEMIRLVTAVLEDQEAAATAQFRHARM